MPLVSVIVPAHNRPEFLCEALASVRAQTFRDYEIIVISNGESAEMRGQSLAAATEAGAKWFALQDGNVSAARNFGVERAVGEWIAFLDDDDLWLPEKVERQIAEARCTGASMIVCDHVVFHPDGRETVRRLRLPKGCSYVKALSHQKWWGAPPSAVLVLKAVIVEAGSFDRLICGGEDNDLWRRIAWRHAIFQMDSVLMRYRTGHISLMRPLNARRSDSRRRDMYGFVKIMRDTPRDLRGELPHPAALLWRWILRGYFPQWLRQPKKSWISLRRRFAGYKMV